MQSNQQPNNQQSLLQWQSQQQLDQQRLLQLQSQSQGLVNPSGDAGMDAAQLDGSRFMQSQQPQQLEQSLQHLQQMQQMQALTEQEQLQLQQHNQQEQAAVQELQHQEQLAQLRGQLEQEQVENALGQNFNGAELDQLHFLQQQQSQQLLEQGQQMSLEELQERHLAAALESLRQEQVTGGMTEQEYQERAIAIAQELGLDLRADENAMQFEQMAQQLNNNIDMGGMDLQQQQEQQIWHDEQQKVQAMSRQLLENNPQITEDELYQAIQRHFLEQSPNNLGVQEALEGVLTDQIPQQAFTDEKNLEQLALQCNVDREQLQRALQDMQHGEIEQHLNLSQPGYMQFNGQEPGPGAEAIPQNPSEQQSRVDDDGSSIDTEKRKAFEKKRDQNFARELRLFYKSLIDKLGRDAIEQISKQSDEICRQIDDAQKAFIDRKKQQKDQDKQRKAQDDSDGGNDGGKNADGSSSSSIPSIVGADNDADSAFHCELYGPNSNIDPDGFIQNVLLQLSGHDDLVKQFKRFLPDDDEDDKKSIERKYGQFRDQLQLLEAQNEKEINQQNLTQEQQQFLQEQSLNIVADMDALDCSGLLRNDNGEVNKLFISHLKNDSFQLLFELLKKYNTTKDTRCVQDALRMYGQQIMCVAEKYQKFVQLELSQQLDQPVDSESGQQALIKYQVEQLGLHMQVVLTLIPQEVIDNYTVMSPTAQPHDADSPDHGSPNQGGRRQQLDNKLLMVSHDESKNKEKNVQNKNDRQSRLQRRQEAKESKEKAAKTVKPTTAASKQTTAAGRKGVKHRGASGRGKKHDDDLDDDIKQRKGGHAAKDDDESDEDGEDVEGKTYTDEGEETEEQVDEQDMEDAQDSDDEADQASPSEGRRDNNLTDRAKQASDGKNVDSDDDYYDSDGNEKIDGIKFDGDAFKSGKGFPESRMRSVGSELQQRYPVNFGDLAKPEIQTFVSLQKQLRSEEEWQTFIKLFALYMDGVIGIKDFFTLFDEKFGNRIKPDLKKEIQDLLPTRASQRRLQSDILKPWNDLENQKFEKITGSSYYKIGMEFRLPICSAKLHPKNKTHYRSQLNERYLSLSMGSENFKGKVRHGNEDLIFKNEDEMYKLDTQIEIFRKCQEVVEQEILIYDQLSLKEQARYMFPIEKFSPMMFYWEKKYKDGLLFFLMDKQPDLINLRDGLFGKLTELQIQRIDQLPQFEEIFKKNFIKSLDHRNIPYKEFLKKFLNKQDQMKEIKLIAQQNQCSVPRSWNQLKGGNCYGSSFYHSFGTFVKNDLKLFDPDDKISDYPIDMKFVDLITRGCGFDKRDQDSLVRNLPATLMEKMPHSRMIFKDKLARNIAIKILCLYIKFAQSLHANDRPRMTENLKHIIKNFLQVSEFQELYDQCCNTKPRHGIESLTSSQIDLMMSQDSNLYYVRRCERLQRSQENPELDVPEEVPPEKSEADKAEHSEGQDSSEDDEPEHKLTERVLRDKGEGNRQKNKGPGTDLSLINKVRNGAEEAQLQSKQINSDTRKNLSPSEQFFNIDPIKIQIQMSIEEIRQENKRQLLKQTDSNRHLIETRMSQNDLKTENQPSQNSPMKDSNILSGSEDDKNSEASNRSGKASNKEDKSVKPSQQNDETTDLKMMKSKDQIEDKDDQSTKKQPQSPEKQGSNLKKNPQKYEKLRMEDQVHPFECTEDKIDQVREEIEQSLFLPFYKGKSGAQEGYSLFYAPPNVFIFLKLFYSLYERVLIAQTLIKDKINQDLAEMSKQDKVKFGICNDDSATCETNPEIVHDVFFKERYEHLLKGIFAMTTQVSQASQQSSFLGIGYSHSHHIMDHNKYEDFSRQLLGKNAFLLFQIDRIISQAVKQLQLMHTDHAYQKSKDLFKSFMHPIQRPIETLDEITDEKPAEDQLKRDLLVNQQVGQFNDRLYLAHYAEQIVDQFSLKDCQNKAMGRQNDSWLHPSADDEKPNKYTLDKFTKNAHGLHQEGSSKVEKETTSGGANTASASAHSNFQAFRFLWSSKSQILSVHYIQLNPYMLQTQSSNSKHFKRIMEENYDLLVENTVQPTPPVPNFAEEGKDQHDQQQAPYSGASNYNRIVGSHEMAACADDTGEINYSKRLHPPIFLKRNMKLMQKIRQQGSASSGSIQINGLVQRIVPHLNQLIFDKEGEDVFVANRKSKLNCAQIQKIQLRKQLKANQIRTKRFKGLD